MNPLLSEMTFSDFWQRKDWNIQHKNGRKRLQRDFFLGENCDVLVDYIIPYSEIGQQFSQILDALGIKSSLPKLNTSKTSTLNSEISEDLKAEMQEFYAEDYTLFNRLSDINKSGWEHFIATHPKKL